MTQIKRLKGWLVAFSNPPNTWRGGSKFYIIDPRRSYSMSSIKADAWIFPRKAEAAAYAADYVKTYKDKSQFKDHHVIEISVRDFVEDFLRWSSNITAETKKWDVASGRLEALSVDSTREDVIAALRGVRVERKNLRKCLVEIIDKA